ncbi:integral membrane protein [Thiorhodococcus drewsii AZ1]|uniref:Integral membrane protein n=1 Tax=Thiorhodococcus drewsii AZ1 TaxID=765913 RepID=G2E5T5_9GAMM|nr:lysylphosphatidylglycerol synthase transmembrane domain-containing protein [Thiorhodococcus drewsii]EGV28580.1 integral membrane protein [Thiorhodococcus drewsii AZ1]
MTPDTDRAIAPPSSEPFLSGWRYRAVIYSVVLSALGYLGASLWGGWHEVTAAVGQIGFIGILIALSLSLLNYGLRFLRWQTYLNIMGHAVPWRPSLRIYLAGFALTTTPGKAGEALRGLLLKRWNVPYPHSFAAFFSERLSDLLAVVLLTLFGLTLYPDAWPIIGLGTAGVALGLLILSNQALLHRLEAGLSGDSKLANLLRHLFQIAHQARRCHQPRLLAGAMLLSLIAWASEAVAFFLILRWMEMDVSLAFAIFVYALSMLAGALSFMPGGLGGAEGVMIGLLLWQGMDNSDAVAATLVIRVATLWFAVFLGFLMLSIRFRDSRDEQTGNGENSTRSQLNNTKTSGNECRKTD